jgi:hypothetical protein
MSVALDQLRGQAYLVLEEDVARLFPFVREHLNVVGNYTFALPDLGEAGMRPLRDPDTQMTTRRCRHIGVRRSVKGERAGGPSPAHEKRRQWFWCEIQVFWSWC